MNDNACLTIVIALFMIGITLGGLQECHNEHEEIMECIKKTGQPHCGREANKSPAGESAK